MRRHQRFAIMQRKMAEIAVAEEPGSQRTVEATAPEPISPPQFVCEECGQICKTAGGLAAHRRKHGNTRGPD